MSVKKYTCQVPRGTPPCSIDDFPAEVALEGKDKDGKPKARKFQRSVLGSLRFTPGDLTVTMDELKHLRKHHKRLARRIRVVGERMEPKATSEDVPKAKRGKKGQKSDKTATSKVALDPSGTTEPKAPKAPKAKGGK